MKLPKSWDELPYTLLEKHPDAFAEILMSPKHGEYRTFDFFGKTAFLIEIIPDDAFVVPDGIQAMTSIQPSVLITCWSLERDIRSSIKLSQLPNDRIFEATRLEEENVWEVRGMVRRQYLNHSLGSAFKSAVLLAKLTADAPDEAGRVRAAHLHVW